MQQAGITAIAYSSLVPLSNWRISSGLDDNTKSQEMVAEGDEEKSPFKTTAATYGVTEAQLLLRWGIQKGYPVLPKSIHPERIRQNFDVFSFEIEDSDMEKLAGFDRGPGVAWSGGDPTVMFD